MSIRIRRLGKKNARKLREIFDSGYGHNIKASLKFLSKIYKVITPNYEIDKDYCESNDAEALYIAPLKIVFRRDNPSLTTLLHEFCHHVQYTRAQRVCESFLDAHLLAFKDKYLNLPHGQRRHEKRAFKFSIEIEALGSY